VSIDEDRTDDSWEFSERADLLTRLEIYYDTVPRLSSTTVDIGPFTLFVARSGWPSYARPQVGASTEVTVDAVHAVLDRQHELNVPCALEWVAENSPHVASVVSAAGMRVERCPLLVLRGQPRGEPKLARMLGSGDVEDLARSQAAVGVAFRVGGTGVGRKEPPNVTPLVSAAARSTAIPSRSSSLVGSGLPPPMRTTLQSGPLAAAVTTWSATRRRSQGLPSSLPSAGTA